jgi:hypothetical protein
MKKRIKSIALMALFIFALVHLALDFVASDGFHYFAERQSRLFLAIAIGVVGGLIAIVYNWFSLRTRRFITICMWGSAAIFSTVITCYISHALAVLALWPLAASLIFWLFFYHSFKKRAA